MTPVGSNNPKITLMWGYITPVYMIAYIID